jgi:hypothetical protein
MLRAIHLATRLTTSTTQANSLPIPVGAIAQGPSRKYSGFEDRPSSTDSRSTSFKERFTREEYDSQFASRPEGSFLEVDRPLLESRHSGMTLKAVKPLLKRCAFYSRHLTTSLTGTRADLVLLTGASGSLYPDLIIKGSD